MSAYGTETVPTTSEKYSQRVLDIADAGRKAHKKGRVIRAMVYRARLRIALRIDAIKSRTTIDG